MVNAEGLNPVLLSVRIRPGAPIQVRTNKRIRHMEKTCETCKFFVPITDHRHFEGACHNMRATLGAVIQTSRASVCNHHENRASGQSTPEMKKPPTP